MGVSERCALVFTDYLAVVASAADTAVEVGEVVSGFLPGMVGRCFEGDGGGWR